MKISAEYAYLDDANFRLRNSSPDDVNHMVFHVELDCPACVFRIEALQNEFEEVEWLRVDASRSTAEMRVRAGASVVPVVERLATMGHDPRPLSYQAFMDDSGRRAQRALLARMGVSAAMAGNIMLLSTSLYAGIDRPDIARAFEWLMAILFLPVLVFGATPFLRSAWHAVLHVRPSIDIPLASAIVLGGALSTYHLVIGNGDLYYDSLAVLVALLLGSRYVLARLQANYLGASNLVSFLETKNVTVVDRATGTKQQIPTDQVNLGDCVAVSRGDRLSVDGIVEADAWFDTSVISGESKPQLVAAGNEAFAGCRLLSNDIQLAVSAVGRETRVGALLRAAEVESTRVTPLVSLTDRVAQAFTIVVLVVGLVFTLGYATVDAAEAIRRGLALVILACPCALALATPLAQSLGLRQAARGGCVVKRSEALERLNDVRQVFVDKTGTLTTGEMSVRHWYPHAPTAAQQAIIHALESPANHPIATVLTNVCAGDGVSVAYDWKEVPGLGVSGSVNGRHYALRAASANAIASLNVRLGNDTIVALYCDDEPILAVAIGDTIRDDAVESLERLRRLGIDSSLLTGDRAGAGAAVASAVGIASSKTFTEQTPEEKLARVAATRDAAMIGDGVNDAPALAAASVGIAVKGSMDASFRVADVYLARAGLAGVADVFELARQTMNVIRRNLIGSLVYNVVAGGLALTGFVNPLVAAVLMPISSTVVVAATVLGMRRAETVQARPIAPAMTSAEVSA